jgi:hypothetical protein
MHRAGMFDIHKKRGLNQIKLRERVGDVIRPRRFERTKSGVGGGGSLSID